MKSSSGSSDPATYVVSFTSFKERRSKVGRINKLNEDSGSSQWMSNFELVQRKHPDIDLQAGDRVTFDITHVYNAEELVQVVSDLKTTLSDVLFEDRGYGLQGIVQQHKCRLG